MKWNQLQLVVFLCCIIFSCMTLPGGEKIQDGDTVAFAGDYFYFVDSVQSRAGYPRLVMEGCKAIGISADFLKPVLNRHSPSALNQSYDKIKINGKVPRWLILSSGSYDAWAKDHGQYPDAVKSLLAKAKADQTTVILLTARPVRGDHTKEFNQKIASFADGEQVRLVDVYSLLKEELTRRGFPKIKTASFTVSGYALTPTANRQIATEILRQMGCSKDQLAQAQTVWNKIPDLADVNPELSVDFATYERLLKAASKRKESLDKTLNSALRLGIEKRLNEH